MRFWDWRPGRRIALVAVFLAISASLWAQDQSNQSQTNQNQPKPDQTKPDQTTQDQNNQNQSSPNPGTQNQSDQQQNPPDNSQPQNPSQTPPAQTSPTQGDDKNDNANPAAAAAQATKDAAIQAADAAKNLGQQTLVKVRDWEIGWATGPYVGRQREMVPMTAEQRRQIYLAQTFLEPSDYFKRMFVALIDQARGTPSQWGGGLGGYSKRFASREGQFIIANSLAALGNATLKYEPRYDQCRCTSFGRRARHAIMRNFLTYNETERELRPQWALYGGAFTGGVIATTWKPHPRNALLNGGYGVLGQAASGSLLNLFVEFAGEINRKLGANKLGAKK